MNEKKVQRKKDAKNKLVSAYIFACYEKWIADGETKGFNELVMLGILVPTNDAHDVWIGNV